MKNSQKCLGSILALLFLAACGGGGGGGDSAPAAPATGQGSGNQTTELSPPIAVPGYSVRLLGNPGEESYAIALNDNGQVVGNYRDRSGRLSAFVWQDGVMTPLAAPGQAVQINNVGQIVGWMEPSGFAEAFVASASGPLRRVNTLGGSSQALAINDRGEIAGRITNGGEVAFITDDGGLRLIAHEVEGYATAINDAGQILIRQLDADNGSRTLLLDQDRLTDLGDLGGQWTQGLDINASGDVVGWAQTASGSYHAFLWRNGVMTDLSAVAGDFSSAVAINDNGNIALKYRDDRGGQGNLLYGEGGLVDLGNFGSSYAVVNDLNNNGQMVGWLRAPDGTLRAFLATPVR